MKCIHKPADAHPVFRIHTASLLKQVLDNPGTAILAIPLNLLGKYLAEVGECAARLNDAKLNRLMAILTIYSCADPESPDHDEALTHKLIYEHRL